MTVLWIDLLSEMGGAQHSLYEVCTTLHQKGVDVVAAVPYGPLYERLKSAGIKVFPVSAVRARKHGWGFFVTAAKLMRAPGTVLQIIRAVKPDIVHTNSLPAFLAASRTQTAIPVIWHVRDMRLPELIAREAAKKAARIIAVSEAVDEYLVDILSPRILGRIRVIRNGIDASRFAVTDKATARTRVGLPPSAPVIGMIAHLVPWKRHDAFIEAAAAIHRQRPDAHFVVAGRDLFHEHSRLSSELKEQVAQAGLTPCFHWIRDLDSSEEILPAFDVLLHPALREPFGRVLCEAMAAGVPIVAAESGGSASLITQHVSGILVRDGDSQQMAEQALALLANPARAAELAAAGRSLVQAQYTTSRVCEQLEKEYRALLTSLTVHDDDE
ncbi:MAG: glycosyltransferase family 4 protein [Kiritimatiellae bacterium]|nr:glycosyltransferase family 4 protein [Kiritimatiellia bacterium]